MLFWSPVEEGKKEIRLLYDVNIVVIQVKCTRRNYNMSPNLSYHHSLSVIWRPDASYAGFGARDGLVGAPQLLSARVS